MSEPMRRGLPLPDISDRFDAFGPTAGLAQEAQDGGADHPGAVCPAAGQTGLGGGTRTGWAPAPSPRRPGRPGFGRGHPVGRGLA